MDVEVLERQEIRKKQIAVGLLFTLAILLTLVFAYWMGAFGLGASSSLFVRYNFAGGIDKGSPVRLAGIRVGRVTAIEFAGASGGDQPVLRVKLDIAKNAFQEITDDSSFFINLAGLIGERYVEIVPGQGARIKANAEFRGSDPPRIDQLLSQGYGIFGDLRSFFNENRADFKEMFTTLNDLSKNLNRLSASTTTGQRHQLSTLLENFSALSSDLRSSVSTVKRGLAFVQENGADDSWKALRSTLQKVDRVGIQDIRRLMLEDGVKVNFSTKKVPTELEPNK